MLPLQGLESTSTYPVSHLTTRPLSSKFELKATINGSGLSDIIPNQSLIGYAGTLVSLRVYIGHGT